MSFRENLRETLDFIYMEQKELAAKTGLSLKTIENYVKKDSSIPSADKAVLIAQALGVSVEYLVTGKESEKGRLLPSLPKDIQKIILASEQLKAKERQIVLTLAQSLKNR